MVLTDERLCFVMGLRHRNETRAPWQRRLAELAGAEISTHRRKATLVLRWRDSPDMSIDGLAQKDLQRAAFRAARPGLELRRDNAESARTGGPVRALLAPLCVKAVALRPLR